MTLLWSSAAQAQEPVQTDTAATEVSSPWTLGPPRYTASLETWAYGNSTGLSSGSLVNPGNRIARIPGQQAFVDARMNLRADWGPVDVLAMPRWVGEYDWAGNQSAAGAIADGGKGNASLSQGFARLKFGGDTALAGRELLTWGPATFRSPSNPFYFDAGKTNPLAELSGIDLVRYTHALGSLRLTGAYVASTSELAPPSNLGQTALLKLDQQGDNYLLSVNAAKRPNAPDFVGGFAQMTPSDAWLVYGEFGVSQQPAPSGNTALGGASYTFETGQVVTAEYLHNQGGFSTQQQNHYFANAIAANTLVPTVPAAGYAMLGQGLANAPRLLGRNYLWLGLQSNPQDNSLYWRTEWTQNLGDKSGQLMLYIEKNMASKWSGFAVLTRNFGSVQTDFGELVRNRLTLGIKYFVF